MQVYVIDKNTTKIYKRVLDKDVYCLMISRPNMEADCKDHDLASFFYCPAFNELLPLRDVGRNAY